MFLNQYLNNIIDYEKIKHSCYFKINRPEDVDVSIVVPVRGRSHFNKILTRHLEDAMKFYPSVKYSITFVEHSPSKEHESMCESTVNYINIPSNEVFNKCLAFNIGMMFGNKAKYYMFHDLDIIMNRDFFKNVFENLNRVDGIALQAFRSRRVLFCDQDLTNKIIQGTVKIENLHTKYPGVLEPAPSQHRAPGGSIFVSNEQFLKVGGYDPELFFGYSIEDAFFYEKLKMLGGIDSCNDPGIEVFHLWHPPLWNSNPKLTYHTEIYHSFMNSSIDEKMKLIDLEKNIIQRYR